MPLQIFSYIHPTDHNTLFVGTGGGVYRTTDSASTWTPFNDIGFNSQTVYDLAMALLSTTTLFATTGRTADMSPWCYTFNSTSVPKSQWQNLDSKKSNNPAYSSLSTTTSLASRSP